MIHKEFNEVKEGFVFLFNIIAMLSVILAFVFGLIWIITWSFTEIINAIGNCF